MKLSFEIPIRYLEELSVYTDFDFALAHLINKNSTYLNFYKKQVEKGRFVILDNSAFELPQPIRGSELVRITKLLNPSVVIAPDFLNDVESTLKEVKSFIELVQKENLKVKIGGVVQGRNFDEWLRCYKEYENLPIDLICIPFDVPFNVNNIKVGSPTHQWMLNRMHLIKKLLKENLLIKKPHHLLGASNPIEIIGYGNFPIEISMDTSSPIVHGLNLIRFNEKGLPEEKIKNKLDFFVKANAKQMDVIIHNIKTLKNWQSFLD
jgi:queuine/archaeosine tRNA-ribosyltransferase